MFIYCSITFLFYQTQLKHESTFVGQREWSELQDLNEFKTNPELASSSCTGSNMSVLFMKHIVDVVL